MENPLRTIGVNWVKANFFPHGPKASSKSKVFQFNYFKTTSITVNMAVVELAVFTGSCLGNR